MTEAQLINVLADKYHMHKTAMKAIVEQVAGMLVEEVIRGDGIKIPLVGVLKRRQVAAHKFRNPKTGELIDIPAHSKIVFKASRSLKQTLLLADTSGTKEKDSVAVPALDDGE